MIPGLAAIRNTATETAIRLTVSLLLYCAPVTKWPYIKNGVGWYDLTEGDWVYSHETFLPGHRYQINVYLKTADGYTFWHDKYYEKLFTASVNSTAAEGNTSGSSGLTQQTILAEFVCTPPDIYTIMVYDLDAPEPRKTPDYEATTAYPEIYRLDPNYAGTNGIVWYNSEGTMLEPTDTFVEGEMYRVELKIIPAQFEGADVCKFVDPLSAYINGEKVTERYDWDAVWTTSKAVYIYYTFFEYCFTQQPQGGLLNVDEALNVTWETSFIPDMYDIQYWDGSEWDQWDCINDPEYRYSDHDFQNNVEETVRFRIVATLGDDVEVRSRPFSITWGSPVSCQWNDTECTVTLENKNIDGTVVASVYENGKMTEIVILSSKQPYAVLTGSVVKIFVLDHSTLTPEIKAITSTAK